MSFPSRFASWCRNILNRNAVERDLDEELKAYAALLIEEKTRAGLPAAEAQRLAQLELGGHEQVAESVREIRVGETVYRVGRDIRLALRMIRRNPVLSAAIILILGLAIGANSAIFSLTDSWVFTSLPVDRPDRLIFIHRTALDGSEQQNFSIDAFERLRASAAPVAGIAAHDFTRLNLEVHGESEPAEGELVSGNLFSVLGLSPALGRLLDSTDDVPGRPVVALISDRYWRGRFHQSDSILGTEIRLNGMPATVVGVLPRQFTGLTIGTAEGDVWIPLALHPQVALRDHSEVGLLGRLAPDITTLSLEDRLSQFYRSMLADSVGASATPTTTQAIARAGIRLASAARGQGSGLENELRILMLVGLLVLLVVCANLANLLLARAIARRREVAIRIALGATHGRILLLLLTESVVLSLLGGALGVIIALGGGEALAGFLSDDPRSLAVTVQPSVHLLLFAAGLSLLSTIIFTVVPVVSLIRANLHAALKSGAAGARGSRPALRLGRTLVVVQVALSLVLLATAGVLVRTVRNMAALDPGFDRSHTLLFAVYPATLGYEGDRELQLYQRLRHRIETLPGVTSASSSRWRLVSVGRDQCTSAQQPAPLTADFGTPVGPRFLQTMGVPLLMGREFTDGDLPNTAPVAILSRAASGLFFPAGGAIGRQIGIAGEAERRTVVGIAGDVGTYSKSPLDRGLPSCIVYIPTAQTLANNGGQQWIEVRAAGDPSTLLPAVRGAVKEIDSRLSLFWPATIQDQVRAVYGEQASLATLSTIFGVLALLFAAIGLLGIISYTVASRSSELGLRLALGARPATIAFGIVRETLVLVVTGVVVGIAAAVGAVRMTSGILYGVSPLDPVSLGGAVATLLIVGFAAAYVPARRASRVNPAITLRRE
ncbi:MAG: ABC transporter permease [Gemmatimonadota bacterium]